MNDDNSTKIFILVDHSIKNLGGHHFEYAERILDCALDRGFKTKLLSHKSFSQVNASAHEVIPTFRRTFWENMQPFSLRVELLLQSYRKIQNYRYKFLDSFKRQSINWAYGWLGYHCMWAWESIRNGHSLLSFGGLAKDANLSVAIALKFILYVYKRILKIKVIDLILRKCKQVFTSAILAIGGLIGLIFIPISFLYHLIASGQLIFSSPTKLFEDDLNRGLRGLNPENVKYIFVPTLNLVELEGISCFLKNNPEYKRVQWGLLYRRNILEGLPHEYNQQIEKIRKLKVVFSKFQMNLPDANISFMTDTDELTSQYNLLQVGKFFTVPVPSDYTLQKKSLDDINCSITDTAPITMSYIGDARDEKGYPVLLNCQRALSVSHFQTGKVRMLIQSNFSTSQGEFKTNLAHKLMQNCYSEGVNLVYGPFDRLGYRKLIDQTDLMLIPYDARNYSARSSGVFAEALAAGIPSVVTGGTWMSNILEPDRQNYLASVFSSSNDIELAHIKPTLIDSISIPTERIVSGLQVNLPANAKYVVLVITLDLQMSTYFSSYISWVSLSGSVTRTSSTLTKQTNVLTRIASKVTPGCNIWVKIEPMSYGLPLASIKVKLEAYESVEEIPLGYGSVIAGSRDIDFVDAVKEAVQFYEYYKKTAIILADRKKSVYDPDVLMDRLILNARAN